MDADLYKELQEVKMLLANIYGIGKQLLEVMSEEVNDEEETITEGQ
jgi:hypothetical protein